MEKWKNIDPIHIIAQEDVNAVEEKKYNDVVVKMIINPSIHTNISSLINQTTSRHEENHIPKLQKHYKHDKGK